MALQTSDFTSIQERITNLNVELNDQEEVLKIADDKLESTTVKPLKPLAEFDGATHQTTQSGISFHFSDYLQLIDWTGRAIRHDKKGFIDSTRPKLLCELAISSDSWLISAKEFRRQYSSVSGRWDAMCEFKKKHQNGRWCKGKHLAKHFAHCLN